VERVGQVSRMARWRFITMVLFYVLALIAAVAAAIELVKRVLTK
jgi:hypothetical protein